MIAAAWTHPYHRVPSAPGWASSLGPSRTFTLLQQAGDMVDELLDELLGSALQQVRAWGRVVEDKQVALLA
jgi:hypothetical protein